MTYDEVVRRLANLMGNCMVDKESKLYLEAYEALCAIATKELEN